MPLPPPRPGLGGLLQARDEHIDLGAHGDHYLRARVRRRSLRIAAGRSRHLALELGRVRPVAIEVSAGAATYDLPVPAPSDPWLRLAVGLALLSFASALALRLLNRRRRATKGSPQ